MGGVCLVRKEKPFLGGVFLGYSALLRVFPSFCLVGPAILVTQQLLGERAPGRAWWKPQPFANVRELFLRIDPRYLRFFAGLALITALLVPISLVTSNGIASYREFYKNSQKHNKTPLTNYMGLKTVMIYRPSEVGQILKNDKLEDPWGHWKQVKLKTAERSKFLLIVAQLAFLVLLWKAARGVEPWVALSMGTMMMAIMFELTCYYYSFMFVVAFLYEKRKEAGALLLAATAMTGFIDWAPTRYLPNTPPWNHLRMPQWLDEQYTWMSLAIIVAFVWILYQFAYPEPQPALAGGPAGGGTPSTPDDEAEAGAEKKSPRRGKRRARAADAARNRPLEIRRGRGGDAPRALSIQTKVRTTEGSQLAAALLLRRLVGRLVGQLVGRLGLGLFGRAWTSSSSRRSSSWRWRPWRASSPPSPTSLRPTGRGLPRALFSAGLLLALLPPPTARLAQRRCHRLYRRSRCSWCPSRHHRRRPSLDGLWERRAACAEPSTQPHPSRNT